MVLIDNIPSPERQPQRGRPQLRQGRQPLRQRRRRRLRLRGATAAAASERRRARPARAARQDPAHHARRRHPARQPVPAAPAPRAATSPAAPIAGNKCQEIFAWGLRNPFRIALRPQRRRARASTSTTSAQRDVGGDRRRRGGRRLRLERARGPLRARLDDRLRAAAGGHDEPDLRLRPQRRLHRDHRRRLRARRASGRRRTTARYLFGDFVCGKIVPARPGGGGGFTATEFATGMGPLIDGMTSGPTAPARLSTT